MQVMLAPHAGFCFGVKRAVEKAFELAKEGKQVCTLGELIHNQAVVKRLEEQGIGKVESLEEVGDRSVLIRSHGVPPSFFEQMQEQGIEYYDLTCPFVKRIHKRVEAARNVYDLIIIVGRAEHPEVVGIKGWAGEKAYVVSHAEQVQNLPDAQKVLIVAQTTITRELLDSVYLAARERFLDVELFDSICRTTAWRQAETREMAQKSDAVIVIGDKNSSNTQKLYEIASKFCKNTQYIESSSDLLLEKISNCDIISIVAGASAPDWIIREVITQMSEQETTQVTEEVQVAPVQEPNAETQEVKEEITAEATETAEVAGETQEAAVEAAEAAEAASAPEEAAQETQEESQAAQAAAQQDDDAKNDENSDFLAELEKTFVKIRRGQFIKGVVVQVSDDEVCVNIGYKSDGIIRKEDLTADGNVSPAEMFKPGDEIEAEVVTLNDGEGNVRLSRKKIESQIKWKALVEDMDPEAVYSCKVTKVIKGGVLSKLEGYDAFIPASQLSLKYVEDLSTFVGQTLDVKVIDVDKRQKRFVLSHKEILKKQAEEEEKKLFESFEKGAVIKGVVKRLTDFGAFVDVGGVDGLLHITDISWVRIKHPKDVLSENQEIEVKILNVDPEKKKISLGYKQLQPKPWDLAPEKYHVGDIVEGKVVRIAPFGAFVELEPTIDGLVHISQVVDRRIEKVEDVLSLGQVITAKVLDVNAEKKRISLSMRALIEDKKAEEAANAPEEEQAEVAEEKGQKREFNKRDREERFSYTIPPVEEATTSLADLFPKMDD